MPDEHYVLGHGDAEVRRLELQSRLIAPGTERVLRAAGLAPGMSVVDIGTGAGDVAMIAADLVGPSGSVLGIDREASVLERARDRARAAGLERIRFETATLDALDGEARFDAVVGRYVLGHQADRDAMLRRAAAHVRPGGILCFIEPALPEPTPAGLPTGYRWSDPPAPLYDQMMDLATVAFVLGGAYPGTGGRLVGLFHEAGLPEPSLLRDDPLSGPDGLWVEFAHGWIDSLLPTLEKHGVATRASLDPATLEARLRDAVRQRHSQLSGVNLVGGWARL